MCITGMSGYYLWGSTLLTPCPLKQKVNHKYYMPNLIPYYSSWTSGTEIQEDKHKQTQLYSLSFQLRYLDVQLLSSPLELCHLLCRANFSTLTYLKLWGAKRDSRDTGGCTYGTTYRIYACVCVCLCHTRQSAGLLTGDLKLECTFLNFEKGVLGTWDKEDKLDNVYRITCIHLP